MSWLNKLPFYRNYTTAQHKKWWENRKIDWRKEYSDTWNHPHRYIISSILKKFHWVSLIEVGCGSGPNLINIAQTHQGKHLGGVDVNKEAIELASKTFVGGQFKVCDGGDIMMSDNSTDVVLSDMTLIYVSPSNIDKHLKEIKRVARNYVVLCEFHCDSWWKRFKLHWSTGYNAYDYKQKLKKLGFYDVILYKIPLDGWPGTTKNDMRYIILGKVPRR